jgi:hypothetical protein
VRKWHPGPQGIRLLAIGAPGGQAYTGNQPTQL